MGPGNYLPNNQLEEEEPEEVGIATPGEYTKQVSGITDVDLYGSYLNQN